MIRAFTNLTNHPRLRFATVLWTSVLLMNILVTGWICYSMQRSKTQLQEKAAADSQNLAHVLEQSIEGTLGKIELNLLAVGDRVAHSKTDGSADPRDLNAYLALLGSRTPDADELHVIDSNGNITNGAKTSRNRNVSGKAYFQYLRDTPNAGTIISDPILCTITHQWLILLARRLDNADGSFGGVVFGTIHLDRFGNLFSSLDIGKTGTINLRNANMRIVARYPRAQNYEQDFARDSEQGGISSVLREMVATAPSIGTYTATVPYDNVSRTVSYRKLKNRPLYVLVGLAEDDYLSTWRHDVLNGSIMGGLFALASFLFSMLLYRDWKARKAAIMSLEHEQAKFRSLASMSSDWFWEQDDHFRFTYISSRYSSGDDINTERLIGKTFWEVEQGDALPAYRRLVEAHHPLVDFEFSFQGESGKKHIISINGEPIFDEKNVFRGYRGVSKDITQQKDAAERERRLMNIYRALSETNEAILHFQDETSLFALVCRIAVDYGGMVLAWVGIPDADNRIRPISSSGKAAAYLSDAVITVNADHPPGRGPTGASFREGRTIVVNDVRTDPAVAQWAKQAEQNGISAIMGLPIKRTGKPYAVLTVYSDETGSFDREIVHLLEGMTANISFALDNADREEWRRQSQEALRESERRFRLVAEESPLPMQIYAEDGEILRINRAWTELSGYTLEDIPTMRTWLEKSLDEEGVNQTLARIRAIIEQSSRRDSGEYLIHCKNGSERIWHFFSSPLGQLADGRRAAISMAMDVTERKNAQLRERRIMNIYHALSATNEAIIHVESEQALFPLVCRIAVKYGGMALAWVGLPDESGRFVPVASDGSAVGYLDNLTILSGEDAPEGMGPTGVAYREAKPVVFEDMSKDETAKPWRDKAEKYGIRAAAAFPLMREGTPYAVLAVYSEQVNAFDEEIIRLLEEMAGNIGYALNNFEREAMRQQMETALIESETRLRRFYESRLVGVVYWKANGEIEDANDKFLELIGYTRTELRQGKINWKGITPPEPMNESTHAHSEAWRIRINPAPREKEFINKDGSRIPVMFAGTAMDDSSGVAFAIDISERKKAEDELKLAAMVYQDSSEAMMVTDSGNRIIAVNPAFEQITGFRADEVLGKNPNFLKSGRHESDFFRAMWKTIDETGRWKGEIWNRAKSGEDFAILLSINTTFNSEGAVLRRVALFTDITKKKESDELIWNQANFDALTGLPNRRLFRDHLKREIRKSKRNSQTLALMFLDLDGFKDVNDTLGHNMGDQLLKQAAERLHGSVREIDIVSRLGGDEFTVILSELSDPANVNRVARHILQQLSEPFHLGDEVAHVSASIGITLYPDDATEIEDLLKNADQAMYAAKQHGKNQYQYFTASMQEAALARMRLVNDMRVALENRQFEVVYQPIVELSSGAIHKAEALIRWQHPTRGLINPAEFIPLAEDTGMINAFGDWVFHEAASQAARWRKNHHREFQISVNISPVQFKKEGIDSSIWFEHLKSLGLPAQGIVVEITEGLLLEASENVMHQLLAFRDAGIEVALDDFGVGYSSLSYLNKFDIDYLKIDQTFIRNLEVDSSDMALCEAIIVMAHKLGLRVIAEGVETRKQRDLLASVGCDFAQGYIFSEPLPPEKIDIMLKDDPFAFQEFLAL